MNPSIALILCISFALLIIKIDSDPDYQPSPGLLVPLLWYMIMVSRNPSLWLEIGQNKTYSYTAASLAEGNPINRTFFFVLIVIGAIILSKRNINWSDLLSRNKWIVFLFLYYLTSSIWSDFPLIVLKRWIRDIGSPIMLLIILTDINPIRAVEYLFKRCMYIFIPLSIIYFKYFPNIGRVYGRWDGQLSISGVSSNKNGLGLLCLLCGIYLVWKIINFIKEKRPFSKIKLQWIISILYLSMIIWILIIADSATSLASFIIASFLLVILEIPIIKHNVDKIGIFSIVCLLIFGILQMSFGIFGIIVEMLGRDPTLTGRTDIWHDCFSMQTNPFFGVGYESFWLGERFQFFAEKYWIQPNEAHSGYIETYLEQGIFGLILLIGFLIATFNKIKEQIVTNFSFGKFKLVLFTIALIYNITEESMKSLKPMWFMLLMTYIVDPRSKALFFDVKNKTS